MKLREWLKQNGRTQAWLAKKLETSQGHVSKWTSGKTIPEFITMLKIEKATKGQVSFEDWVTSDLRRKKYTNDVVKEKR